MRYGCSRYWHKTICKKENLLHFSVFILLYCFRCIHLCSVFCCQMSAPFNSRMECKWVGRIWKDWIKLHFSDTMTSDIKRCNFTNQDQILDMVHKIGPFQRRLSSHSHFFAQNFQLSKWHQICMCYVSIFVNSFVLCCNRCIFVLLLDHFGCCWFVAPPMLERRVAYFNCLIINRM